MCRDALLTGVPDARFRCKRKADIREQLTVLNKKDAEALLARALRVSCAVIGEHAAAVAYVERAARQLEANYADRQACEIAFFKILVGHLLAQTGEPAGQSRKLPSMTRQEFSMLLSLPAEDRLAIALCTIDGLSYAQAARLLDKSEQQLVTQLACARRRLWAGRA